MRQIVILGVSAFQHDSSAAIVVDGALRAHADQERFDGVKHSAALPTDAASWCLKEVGVCMSDLTAIAFYMDPSIVVKRFLLEAAEDVRRGGISLLWERGLWIASFLREIDRLKRWIPHAIPLQFVPHHHAHAAYALSGSPFDSACVVTIDSIGEYVTTGAFRATRRKIEPLESIGGLDSLGYMYGAITEWLGFTRGDGEGTVMALAAMVRPDPVVVRDLLSVEADGRFSLNRELFEPRFSKRRGHRLTSEFEHRYGPFRRPGFPLEYRHLSMAASLQRVTEEAAIAWSRRALQRAGVDDFCFGGGVALNSVLNSRLRTEVSKYFFVAPASNDSGASAGAAFVASMARGCAIAAPDLVQLGPAYTDEEVACAVAHAGVHHEVTGDPARAAAELILEGLVVGWFQGAMESGPRALGNRSILADPRRPEMKDIVNLRVKFREPYRPFAASVLEEMQETWFDTRGAYLAYMLEVVPARQEHAGRIPAVLHMDGTCRIQSVRRSVAPRFHALISHFHERTGVPMVLNTSFNIKGRPIVCTPSDAIGCFYSTGIDALVIGCVILRKRQN